MLKVVCATLWHFMETVSYTHLYKGRIKGWDVVNEAIEDNGAYRKTKFYEILGEEYIPLAFQYAHEADPDAELYYNDYSMAQPGRREAVVKMVNDLKKRGIRIDAIGSRRTAALRRNWYGSHRKAGGG